MLFCCVIFSGQCLCHPICPSVHPSALHPSIHSSCSSIHLPFHPPIHSCIYPSLTSHALIYPSIPPSVLLSSIHPSALPSVCLFICSHIHPPIRPSARVLVGGECPWWVSGMGAELSGPHCHEMRSGLQSVLLCVNADLSPVLPPPPHPPWLRGGIGSPAEAYGKETAREDILDPALFPPKRGCTDFKVQLPRYFSQPQKSALLIFCGFSELCAGGLAQLGLERRKPNGKRSDYFLSSFKDPGAEIVLCIQLALH